jgi:hypothetical protein
MCRNITTLRGLEPGATDEEIEAGARQYVPKISSVLKTSAATEEPFEPAAAEITAPPPHPQVAHSGGNDSFEAKQA